MARHDNGRRGQPHCRHGWQCVDECRGDSRPFNIMATSVNRAVKQVLKADVLNDYEVLKLIRLDNGLLMEFYSMELIIVLSYKWNTFYTNLFRKWMMKRMFESRKEIIPMFLSSVQSDKGGFC
ncbi:RhuM protein [Parabacteroides faecis]|uniref:Uncharacterized protein n=1 Tax=Parabacteroides faecis TaxID=1217282 RepID=A0ABR6KKH7_9BACT|nr:RhuM protein [Parabacteroides faecis]MBB4622008.1 hypothetical protein [Parabacteroides faecis]